MKIKLLKNILSGNPSKLLTRGSVLESNTPNGIAEYKALIRGGCAVESKDKVGTATPKFAMQAVEQRDRDTNAPVLVTVASSKPAAPPPAAPPPAGDDADLVTILKGTVGEVTDDLGALDADQLTRLAELEIAGQNRKGVADAIAAEQAALAAK